MWVFTKNLMIHKLFNWRLIVSTNKSITTRETILIEACKLVGREGVSHLTLEGVAKEAGMSKGGLLYHFPTKDTLIKEMINYVMELSNNHIEEHAALEENDPGKWLRGFANSSFEQGGLRFLMSSGLLATMLSNSEWVESWRERYVEWHQKIENDHNDLILGYIVFLAVDGLWYADLLGLNPPQGELRQKILETLIKLTKMEGLGEEPDRQM
ncbi:TetR family transcriptional regulator [Bacillus canaveralius]|uniref:TetR family transcriptional regulator n=1 Tax=Bacillus canaveralius TaxID=1403243 RepID=A0A2N5GI31_9BACI|nr:TetR family transcriptional regulator [Bacillus canaveralius]PLR92522.1 TetR family transcriptional regulator [Bacillus canaveralius]